MAVLDVWVVRQQIVSILKADTALVAKLASASAVFDSRAPEDAFEASELPAIVVDSPQDSWTPRSIAAPTFEATTNFVIEVHVGECSGASAAVAQLRDEIVSLAVTAVLGHCDLWSDWEQAGDVTLSRRISLKERLRGGAQILFSLKGTVEVPLYYGTETTLTGIDATVDMVDPEQGDDTPAISANWNV